MQTNVIPLTPLSDGVLCCKNTALPQLFVGLSKRQCLDYVDQMERDTEFSKDVIRVTGKTTIVVVASFLEFLRKMENERFEV